ncbi:SDR family NAD(P)-dependent oxidoreductase [Rhodoferax sp. TS-BS-61-7]|uniref:SDR family NAD(P)-dependent oxidoreductase n=1 Tax=Rhodoferax sp. TS-BS-61-7 TaxID=2094194 RepID=UPI000CF60334|nr:SDR family oxidoreductase [Rhodoferax sp. TS-BS-61-7]PQA79350.1 3-oxoacyl-ACP reductase [Rhodoferax sp. TS-BS-61-7]
MSAVSGLAQYLSLRGKSVFITGGGTGIGAAMVSAFAEQGAQVAFVDVAAAESEALAAQLRAQGATVWWQSCDVRDVAALQQAIASAQAVLGDFSVLVNNVARDDRHTLESVTPEYWDERMAVNQRPAFFAIQAIAPGMRRLGGGAVINLGSTGWQTKGSGYPCYAVAKSSVNGLTRGLADSLGADRIRINTVSPGWVMTERQIAMWLDAAGEADIQRNQCLPDKLRPSDVARMVLFLASDDGAMCTAQEFKVDAGWA